MSCAPRAPRVVAGIQARTGSSRLPRKVMADLEGRTLIERVVERARMAQHVDAVVVLTSNAAQDDELAALCEAREIEVRRGDEHDVLSRYLGIAAEMRPEYVVRITGDCPLIEPAFIDRQLELLLATGADFARVAPGGIDGTLCGMGAMSRQALKASAESVDPRDREHVGTFFFERERARFVSADLEVDPIYRHHGLRLTVDEPADLALVRAVYAEHAPFGRPATFSTASVIRWLELNPDVAALNSGVEESADNRALRRMRSAG